MNLADFYAQLEETDGTGRTELLLQLIEEYSGNCVSLAPLDGHPALLDGVDVSCQALAARDNPALRESGYWSSEVGGVDLRAANLEGASLRQANLEGGDLRQSVLRDASLGSATLTDAWLEGADLRGADLVNARLRGAHLAEAVLEGAMLEDAELQSAHLRFANLRNAVLEGADLDGADLWSAHLERAVLIHATASGAVLREADLSEADLTGANLRGAVLVDARLQGACMAACDLRDVSFSHTDLSNAVLSSAQLQDLDLSTCILTHIHLANARLDRTVMRQDQLGGALGEEIAGNFVEAGRGYLALERNFQQLGDPDAASWAYRKRRRMQKLDAGERARAGRAAGTWRDSIRAAGAYSADQCVEWLCDYGESIPRVLGTLIGVYILFTFLYGITNSVVHVTLTSTGQSVHGTQNVLDMAIFSLLAMTTSGSPAVGLLPRTETVHLLTGVEALCGIFLTGLLGFVVGNRIRR